MIIPYTLPIQYKSWDEGPGHGAIIFNDVTFIADFGKIPQGKKYSTITVDFLDGTIHHEQFLLANWRCHAR